MRRDYSSILADGSPHGCIPCEGRDRGSKNRDYDNCHSALHDDPPNISNRRFWQSSSNDFGGGASDVTPALGAWDGAVGAGLGLDDWAYSEV